MEKAVLKNFVIFTGKYQCWSIFLKDLQAHSLSLDVPTVCLFKNDRCARSFQDNPELC